MTLQHPNDDPQPNRNPNPNQPQQTPFVQGSQYPAPAGPGDTVGPYRDHVLTDGSVVRTNPDGTTTHLSKDQVARETAEDESEYPKGWTVSDLGRDGYLVAHDGRNDNGTYDAGQAHKVSKVDDVALVIEHNGRVPEGVTSQKKSTVRDDNRQVQYPNQDKALYHP